MAGMRKKNNHGRAFCSGVFLSALLAFAGCDESAATSTATAQNDLAVPSKLGLCAGCHGSNGKAVLPIYPNLQGQNQPYLEKSLRAYKSGERNSAEMRAMMGTLTDAEIVALAAYYSAQ
jgi:cytochrome c553